MANCEAAQIYSGGMDSRRRPRRGRRASGPKSAYPAYGYRIKDTTIAMVSKAIVAINTLWPQRAIDPSILNLPVTQSQDTATRERLQPRRTTMGAIRYSSTLIDVKESTCSLRKLRFCCVK
jgi:hypothetical protein